MLPLLQSRRSIRKYTSQPLAAEQIEILKEAVLRAPSSRGLNPWEFVFVDDRELLTRLSSAKAHGAEFLAQAALGIVICADERQSDVWVEDCSIAAILAQLVAHSLGLGSCWVQIRNRPHDDATTAEAYLRAVLNLPDVMKVEAIISIGYPAETKRPIPTAKLPYQKIHQNCWHET